MLMTIAEELEQKGREQGIERGIKQGIEKGIEQGRKQGKEESKLEIARSLLQLGVSLDIIITSTGLSRDKIEELTH